MSGHGTYSGDRECPRCGTRWVLLVDRPDRQPLRTMTCGPCRTQPMQRTHALTSAATEPLGEPLGDWAAAALCQQTDPELFFPEQGGGTSGLPALRICQACPVTTECLHYALETHQPYGIWGGMTAYQRRQLTDRVSA